MSHHIEPAPTAIASTEKIRSIARRFGRETLRRPVSVETDSKLRAAHVRAGSLRPQLY